MLETAQSIGARWGGRSTGTLGSTGCFSFYPGKNLGAAGEGGLVVTHDATTATRLRSLRHHAQGERFVHGEVGFNYRMDGLQAAVLRRKLGLIEKWTKHRRALAGRFQSALSELPIGVPAVHHQDHVWHLFVIRTPQRDRLRAYLSSADIETGLHYPVPLHRQACLQYLALKHDEYPRADRWADEGLSLPLFYGMTMDQVDRTVGKIREFCQRCGG